MSEKTQTELELEAVNAAILAVLKGLCLTHKSPKKNGKEGVAVST